ncbi:MAG: Gfo/Idh/MocA family oxidoreductase, partial [Verrucomicrobia bacterium]|nr:Gfo/Idh/MocA family oxidoreductase [Verrucomicrobiota bacterium]
MNENESDVLGYNRRDFLRGGSVATLMAMMGGVELFAQTAPAPAGATKAPTIKIKVGVIGLGAWGREIINTLARMPKAEIPIEAEVAAICDTYKPIMKRTATSVPAATQTVDYKTILENQDIKAVFISTPTPGHKDVALAALKAGKHVYCEAPLAGNIEDAREIALAAKAAKHLAFQAGLQMRSDKQRLFLLPFIRTGALGKTLFARAQWHKKTSWRAASSNPEQEKALNWRLSKETSLGLIGEIGSHAVDQAGWFMNMLPTAVTGFGSINFYKDDGRDVPDTVQAMFEFPGDVRMIYDATLANSFDGEYEMLYGSDAAIMMRESKAWMFKEVDSPLLGWEVYADKLKVFNETGIALVAGKSKAPPVDAEGKPILPDPLTTTPLFYALSNFLLNSAELTQAAEDYKASYGADDTDGLMEELGKKRRRAAAGYLEGFQA